MSEERKLLAAWTPQRYAGDFPPYINLTMIRGKGNVVLTARQPTVAGAAPGETSSVNFTREMWREFMEMIGEANKVFEACDYLDAII